MKKFIFLTIIFLSACTQNSNQPATGTNEVTLTPFHTVSSTPSNTPSPTITITPSPTFTSTSSPTPTPTPIKIGLDSWQDLELINVQGYGEIINVSYSNSDMPFGVGFNHGALFFDPKENKELGSFSSLELLTNLTVSSDGKFGAVSAEIDNIPYILILDTQTGDVIERIDNIENPILYVKFSSTGRWLASGGYKGIDIWDTSNWEKTRSFEGYGANFLDFSNNDNYLALIYSTNFQVWDLTDEISESPIFYKRFINPLTSLSFHPQNNIVALAQDEGNIFLFDIDKKVEITRWKDPECSKNEFRNKLPSILFMDSGSQLASSCDNLVIVWDVFTKSIIWNKSFPYTNAIQINPGPDDLSFNIQYTREKHGNDGNDNIVYTKIISIDSTSGGTLNELKFPSYGSCLGGNARQFFDDLLLKLFPIWGSSFTNKYINIAIPDLSGYFNNRRIVKSNDGNYIGVMYTSYTYKSSKLIVFDSNPDLNNRILSLDINHNTIGSISNPIFNNESTLISFTNGGHVLTYEILTGNLISDVDVQPYLPSGYSKGVIYFNDKIYSDDGLLIIKHSSGLYFLNPSTNQFLGKIEINYSDGYLVLSSDQSRLALTTCGSYLLPGHINWQMDSIITIWGINSSSEK